MPEHAVGQSSRVLVAIPLEVMETDIEGHQFMERTQTFVVGPHGALIPLRHKLAPDQELILRFPGTNHEAEVRVIGQIAGQPDELLYGVVLLDPSANFWGIDFPPLAETETRILLCCSGCGKNEKASLNEIEFEIFAANQSITRKCGSCAAPTIWKRAAPSASRLRARSERKEVRAKVKLTACLRLPDFNEEIIICENVSRGGFCFRSRRRFAEGFQFEAAIPYWPKGANTFVAAQVAHRRELPEAGLFEYGVMYLTAPKSEPKS